MHHATPSILAILFSGTCANILAADQHNVLLIMVDDLRDNEAFLVEHCFLNSSTNSTSSDGKSESFFGC